MTPRALPLLAVALLVAGLAPSSLPAVGAQGPDANPFVLALTGDSIMTRSLSVHDEPEFLRLIDLIRGADAAFTNVEMLFHDYEFPAMTQSGGTYMRAEPSLARELLWAGFDLGSLANNHAGDYGSGAMLLTGQYVTEAGLIAAGTGRSLSEAREAKFLETAKGRLALISVAATFPDHSRAGRSRDDTPPRPGLNPLRHSTTYVVTQTQMDHLRDVQEQLGRPVPGDPQSLSFLGSRFIIGERPAVQTVPDPTDLAEIEAVVQNASRQADYTIVSTHAHESAGDNSVPAEFVVSFARAMIDAGADVFVGHGPHVLRGIEIYKGRPIFYSLGDFIFQNETLLRLPAENYESYDLGPSAHVADFNDARYDMDRRGFPAIREIWESVVAIPTWNGKRLAGIELHPISLGFGRSRTERGRPMLAEPDLGRKIIDDLTRLSRPFGTTVVYGDGLGRVELPAESSANAR